MVRLGFVSKAEGALEDIVAEENVAVGEEQPGGCGLTSGESHSVGLAHPALGEVVDVEDGEGFPGWLRFGGEAVHDSAGCVGGAVVDGDDVDGDGLGEEGAEGGFDAGGFIAGGDDDGDVGGGRGGCGFARRVVAGVEEVGDLGQVVEGGEGDAGPEEGDEPGEDDGENVEGVHGCESVRPDRGPCRGHG